MVELLPFFLYNLCMKKLILTDLDGTLVNSKKEVPSDFYQVYNALKKQDIVLGIATGRSYSSIQRDFAAIADDSFFVAEGGSVVIYKGKILKTFIKDKAEAIEIAKVSESIPNSFVIVSCVDRCYTKNLDNPEFLRQVNLYHSKHEIVDNFDEIEDDIIKVSIFCGNYNAKDYLEKFDKFKETSEIVLGGAEWIDLCVKGASKASGVDLACEQFRISKDDIIAFGDYMNDYELLKRLKNSYAMANAHPKIKEICNYEIGSNDDNAVLNTIVEMFKLFN